MKPEAERDNGIETPANAGNAVLGILNDLQLRLQRIEVALAAPSGEVESARKREIEQRRGYTTRATEDSPVNFMRWFAGDPLSETLNCQFGRRFMDRRHLPRTRG
jgi:hypothetical protein